MTTDASHRRAYIVLAIGLTAASTGALFIRLAELQAVPALTIVVIRLLIATTVLAPITFQRYRAHLRQLQPRDFILTAVSGFFLAAHFTTLILGLQYVNVLVNQVLANASPLWVALLESLLLKAVPRRSVWIGLGLALAGGLLIALAGNSDPTPSTNPALGIVLSALSSVAAALYIIIGRSIRPRVATLPYIWLLFTSAAVTAVIAMFITRTPLTGYSTEGYLWVLLLTLCSQLIGHSSFNYALGYLSATYVSISGQVVTIAGALLAFLFLNERHYFLEIPGSLAIIAGVLVVTLSQRQLKS